SSCIPELGPRFSFEGVFFMFRFKSSVFRQIVGSKRWKPCSEILNGFLFPKLKVRLLRNTIEIRVIHILFRKSDSADGGAECENEKNIFESLEIHRSPLKF